MTRQIVAAAALLVFTAGFAPQQDSFSRNFRAFKDLVPGIDFFATARTEVTPFETPIREAREKLATFLGKDLARGALVVCSTLEQKDSVTEARLLRMGYRWVLIQFTPEVDTQQMLARIKAQFGGQIPPMLMDRIKSPSPEMKAASVARLATSAAQKVANAILVTTLTPDKEFRSSRLDDMGKSPLADWLDVGILSYSAGSGRSTLRFLQDRIEEAFPLEDVISMSRPFVAPTIDGNSGGGGQIRIITPFGPGSGGEISGGAGAGQVGMRSQGSGGDSGEARPGGSRGEGGAGRSANRSTDPGGMRPGNMMNLPKDVQDRMLFDAEASSFFAFLIEKVGTEKCKSLVTASRENRDVRDLLLQQDMLGSDFDAIERDWQSWMKQQKPDVPPNFRIMTMPAGKPGEKP